MRDQGSYLTARKLQWDGSRMGWGMGSGSANGVCPVHLLDGCGLVSGHGGAEKIVGCSVLKEKCVQG